MNPDAPRCATCTHWTGDVASAGLAWGRCAIVPDGNGPTTERPAENVAADGNDGWESWLDTRADFGCVNHEPVPHDPQDESTSR